MHNYFHKEMVRLKRKLLLLATRVEESFRRALDALDKRDEETAKEVIASDADTDALEVELEEDCLKALALYQPVAVDLRFTVAVLKINNDLERIGDLAVNLAERALFQASDPEAPEPFEFGIMARKAAAMLRDSIRAFVEEDADLARRVLSEDDAVDALNRRIFAIAQDGIKKHPERVGGYIRLLSVSRYVERAADHATNIAEDVLYLLEGDIVRHGGE